MFDAANAASGLTYKSVAWSGGAVSGVSVDAAALAAGYTALQAIFANNIWLGVGRTNIGGSPLLQTTVLNEINATYAAALNTLGIAQSSSTPNLSACGNPSGGLVSLCGGISLGTAAGNANLTARGYKGGQ